MNPVLMELVGRGGGLVTRATAVQVVPEWTLERACHVGDLVRVLPEVFAAAHLLADRPCRAVPAIGRLDPELGRRAVLAWADGRGALSHLCALAAWGLHRQAAGDLLHLSVPAGVSLRSRPGVAVHRRQGLVLEPPHVMVRRGLAVTRIEPALVDSWPILPPGERRAPVIQAVNDRLTTPERLEVALGASPRLNGRVAFRTLLRRLAEGCRSPLEIWGHERVFTGPGMPRFRRQVPIRLGSRTVYLDLYAEPERVNIELDGATTHGDPHQREIDLRRDAQLAALGILVVRFAHRRLVHEIEEVRRETLAILSTRRPDTSVPPTAAVVPSHRWQFSGPTRRRQAS
ncbi:endonuclease domain-containing protein [Micromonospora sp. NPDC093277]|uniref:endonuclease domain-containing protein n=1 Tax=Micromonospora sp. NPDC093277 TaxID=3364291 RepID=UPI00382A676D